MINKSDLKIFIVGMPACGKSTFGKKLAHRLKIKFYDLDKIIEKGEGKSINSIFEELGEKNFRELERFYLMGLKNKKKSVISTGGGTPAYFDNMEWMNKHGISIYLDVKIEELIIRNTRNKAFRPLFANNSDEEIKEKMYNLLETREPFYLLSSLIHKDSAYYNQKLSIDNQHFELINEIILQDVDF